MFQWSSRKNSQAARLPGDLERLALDVVVPGAGHMAEGRWAGWLDQIGNEKGAAWGEVAVQVGEEVALGGALQVVNGEGRDDGAEVVR